jgi:ATP-dependent helicase HrpB
MALPIDALLPQLRDSLTRNTRLVLQAAPGAGKTTRVPLALLACDWLQGRRILMLEPRRLAARAAARFMAHSLGERIGGTVGYRVRQDTRVGPATRIEVITEGVLTRLLHADPALEDVGLVIFDEFHERSLHADLGLALCLDSQAALRDDLRLLVMSATLDAVAVAALLEHAPVLQCAGQSYPVELHYRALNSDFHSNRRVFCHQVAAATRQIVHATQGSLLLFLPGSAEIRSVLTALQGGPLPDGLQLAPLLGQQDSVTQERAIAAPPPGQRKLVLATAIAETSLTIEGIAVVIDAGLMRQARFDPNTGLERLVTLPVTAAAATQRAGRAGRLQPGQCFRLWSESRSLVPYSDPEILHADLAPLWLELAQWGVRDVSSLRWLDQPPAAHLAQARDLLLMLEAIDATGAVTAHGRVLAGLGVHPRLAHMLVRGRELGYARLACELAAVLSERDPLGGDDSDIQLRVEWLRAARVDAGKAQQQRLRSLADGWLRQLGGTASRDNTDLVQCGNLLAFAYPDRIAQRRSGADQRFLLSNGRGARFRAAEPLAASDYILAAHLDGEKEAAIYLAAALSREQLEQQHAALIDATEFVRWDTQQQAVLSRSQRRLGALVLADRLLQTPAAEAVHNAMLDGVRASGLDCLPWTDSTRQLQARIGFLHRLEADSWPDYSDAALEDNLQDWLAPFLMGMTRLAHLRRLDLHAALLAPLSWEQQRALERLAPTHLAVPSGARHRLDYSGDQPVLAVRLQELFGLADTPRLADGRVPLVLQLLSPARRPVQVTQDLAAFWRGSYHAVKKDMKGRYPKHPWPDDPLNAPASCRAKPRKS